jgi:transposase
VLERPAIQRGVTPVVWHAAPCPRCACIINADLPAEDRSGYGPQGTARLGERSGPPWGRRSPVQAYCPSVLGGPISRGAIQRAGARVAAAIKPHDEAMAQQARRPAVNSLKETAGYPHGVWAWLGVMVQATVAWFTGPSSRKKAAFETLVERRAGILLSDGDGVSHHWGHGRQTCLAPLLRRARGLAARHDPALASCGRRGMTEWPRLVHWATAPPTSGEGQTW